MRITKHSITAPGLIGTAAFIWRLTSEADITGGRLLPVMNTDLIINLSRPIFYTSIEGERMQAPPVHIRNVKLRSQFIDQEAPCDVWGVSFFPYGVYALLGGNLAAYVERVTDMRTIHPHVCDALVACVCGDAEEAGAARRIEAALAAHLKTVPSERDRKEMERFLLEMPDCGVGDYCQANGIGIKRLERLMKKYTGLTPKQLQRIARFQKAGNEMLYSDSAPSIADVAYDNHFADQMHLTKTFRAYAGVTPFHFLRMHDSVKEKLHREE